MERFLALVGGVGVGAGLLCLLDTDALRDDATDAVVVRRARWRARRVLSDPRAVDIRAHQGKVVLTGLAIADEARALLSEVAAIHGVATVEDQLERFDPVERPARSSDPALRTAGRIAATAAGAALAFHAARRRGGAGMALGGVALGLLLVGAAAGRPDSR